MFFLSRHFVYRSICKMVSREARGYLRSRETHFEPKRSPRKMTPRFIKDALGARVQEMDWRSNKKEEQGKRKRSATSNFETQIRYLTSVGAVSRLERWTKESFPPESFRAHQVSSLCSTLYRGAKSAR